MPNKGAIPEGRKGVFIHLPEEDWRQLKIRAMDNRTTLRAQIEEAVQRYLKEQQQPAARP
jgi:hypothetical protein